MQKNGEVRISAFLILDDIMMIQKSFVIRTVAASVVAILFTCSCNTDLNPYSETRNDHCSMVGFFFEGCMYQQHVDNRGSLTPHPYIDWNIVKDDEDEIQESYGGYSVTEEAIILRFYDNLVKVATLTDNKLIIDEEVFVKVSEE